MNYNNEDLRQGAQVKSEAKETPQTFATNDGASVHHASSGFGKQRMAGEEMARLMQLTNDPAEQQRTDMWMDQFGMSNEGMEFNQARMMMANPQPQQELT